MTPGRAAFVIVALAAAAASLDAQNANMAGRDEGLTYSSGQSVVPVYAGWSRNADGTFDLHFSYLNRNWQEHLHIPIGPDNNIGPATFGPDGGQPTYFLPRNNRWVFSVRVPAEFGTRELVWTLTSHGLTYRAHGTLDPGYAVDDFTIQHEYGSDSTPGRKPPTLRVEGEKRRAARVGERVPLAAVAIDDNPPPRRIREAPGSRASDNDAALTTGSRRPGEVGPGQVGGDSVRSSATGLRFAWHVYRGAGGRVHFDPPIPFKVWEDQRGGSPWAPGWQPPPIPPGNRWTHTAIFDGPGPYVLRALAHNGSKFTYDHVTVVVTP